MRVFTLSNGRRLPFGQLMSQLRSSDVLCEDDVVVGMLLHLHQSRGPDLFVTVVTVDEDPDGDLYSKTTSDLMVEIRTLRRSLHLRDSLFSHHLESKEADHA